MKTKATDGDVREVPTLALGREGAVKARGIGVRKLWELTACGEIPHVRIGARVVYPVHLLRAYLTQKAEGGGRDSD
mgnify:CR=1 FL=1